MGLTAATGPCYGQRWIGFSTSRLASLPNRASRFAATFGPIIAIACVRRVAVIVAALPDGSPTAFIGPVMSYYEHVTLGFKRLTDEEWATMYDEPPSLRPAFSNIYLADREGRAMPGGLSLSTGIERDPVDPTIPGEIAVVQNNPNPFREATLVRFSVPPSICGQSVTLHVYTSTGRLVARLIDEALSPGHYTVRWNGTSATGAELPAGTYGYILTIGGRATSA